MGCRVGIEGERRVETEYFVVVDCVEFVVGGAGDAGGCVLVCEA